MAHAPLNDAMSHVSKLLLWSNPGMRLTKITVPSYAQTILSGHTSHQLTLALFNRDAFGQVAWLVNVSPSCQRGVIRQQLQRHHVQYG